MTIILPLAPQEEAKLAVLAQSKTLSPDGLVREVLEKILTALDDVLIAITDPKNVLKLVTLDDQIVINMRSIPR